MIDGEELANAQPIKAIKASVSHIPEDRTQVGSAPNLSITDNTIMKCYREAPIGNGVTINHRNARTYARGLKDAYDILAPSVHTQARKLSGGNLQKVILAREISTEPKLMVAVQPTRGLDVGAIEAIQRLLLAQREAGTAVLADLGRTGGIIHPQRPHRCHVRRRDYGTLDAEDADVEYNRPDDDRDPLEDIQKGVEAKHEPAYSISVLKNARRIIPKWLPAATSLGAVVVAFIISGIILKLIGGQPLVVAKFFWERHFWQLADLFRHTGQGHAADHGGPGLCGRL